MGRRIGCRDGERGEKKHGRSRRDRMKCPSFFYFYWKILVFPRGIVVRIVRLAGSYVSLQRDYARDRTVVGAHHELICFLCFSSTQNSPSHTRPWIAQLGAAHGARRLLQAPPSNLNPTQPPPNPQLLATPWKFKD